MTTQCRSPLAPSTTDRSPRSSMKSVAALLSDPEPKQAAFHFHRSVTQAEDFPHWSPIRPVKTVPWAVHRPFFLVASGLLLDDDARRSPVRWNTRPEPAADCLLRTRSRCSHFHHRQPSTAPVPAPADRSFRNLVPIPVGLPTRSQRNRISLPRSATEGNRAEPLREQYV
jgi:hypothetical protein